RLQPFSRAASAAGGAWPTILSADGRTAAVYSPDGTASFFDTDSGRAMRTAAGLEASAAAAAFSPSLDRLAILDQGTVALHDLGSGQRRVIHRGGPGIVNPGFPVQALSFAGPEHLVYIEARPSEWLSRPLVQVFDVRDGRRLTRWELPAPQYPSWAVSGDG